MPADRMRHTCAMESQQALPIKYSPVFPILILLSSLVILFTSLLIGFSTNTILGVALLFVSVLMLTRPILVLTPTAIEHRNLLGRVMRTSTFAENPPSIRDNALYMGGKKAFPQWMTGTKLATIEQFLKSHGALPAA